MYNSQSLLSGGFRFNGLQISSSRMSIRARLTTLIQKTNFSVSIFRSAMLGRIAPRRLPLGTVASYSRQQRQLQGQQQQQPQRAEFSTLRRGLTGPMSARERFPMRGLEEFRDPHPVKAGDEPVVGRPWTVPELRKKSFEDLHRLWFVLYKEKNMLMTELTISRRTKAPLPAGGRRQKVKRSMKAIKVVVGERQRLKRGIRHEKQMAAKRQEREAQRAALALQEGKEMAGSVDVSTLEKVDSKMTIEDGSR